MRSNHILMLGDALLILAFMIVGLGFHESDSSRLLPNLVPFGLAWALAGYYLNQWAPPTWRSILSVVPAMLLAAPLGAVLRAAWLGGVALPLFTAITAAGLALVLMVWRALYLLIFAKRKS
ncbi:MAG: DUF3054 domain-containing protein [Anaerolineales bacterium]|nr:MAG: DUF3054 domain-containing protein [Anaerolineales bacterium]